MGLRDELQSILADPSSGFDHADATVRRLAVTMAGESDVASLARALGDDDATVRAAAVEQLAVVGGDRETVMEAADDHDERVVEAVATALGELEDEAALPWLTTLAKDHTDKLVREAAVAALGAIGHPDALPVLLELLGKGPPQVRRRCVVALTVFDVPGVEEALQAALDDRNPMVREAAEMVVGRPVEPPGPVPLTISLKPRPDA
ncbi:MAG: hypothetical protein HKN07_13520 [Acidimicrobiia bacterium]|nr:hypothetical protein [Acidimicrobiia bacterium]